MDQIEKNLLKLLAENGFYLAREKRHRVYKNPNGKIWVMPATASDHHAYRNNLENFKRWLEHGVAKSGTVQLGIDAEARRRADAVLHPARPRPEKQIKARRIVQKRMVFTPSFAPAPVRVFRPVTTPARPDIYKIGRAIDLKIRGKLMAGYRESFKEAAEAAIKLAAEEYQKLKDEGALPAVYEKVKRDNCAEMYGIAGSLNKEIPRMVNALVRLFQNVVKHGLTRDAHGAEIEIQVLLIMSRYGRRCRARTNPDVAAIIVADCWEAVAPFQAVGGGGGTIP